MTDPSSSVQFGNVQSVSSDSGVTWANRRTRVLPGRNRSTRDSAYANMTANPVDNDVPRPHDGQGTVPN